jgi:hypothetical protein
MALGALVIGAATFYRNSPEPIAARRLEAPSSHTALLNRPGRPGEWGARPVVSFINSGTAIARQVRVEYQHRPGTWTGVVPFGEPFDVAPGETKGYAIWADTVADPGGALSSGAHLYFAIRVRWTNDRSGTPGCFVNYLDIHEEIGPNVGERIFYVDVLSNRPESIDAPAIAACS